MEQRPLGRSGIWVGRLALGTMTWANGTDEYEARDQLAVFLDAGGSLVDTADVYAEGEAESMLGEIVAEFGIRERIVIATKAGSRPGPERRFDASRAHLLRTLDASLQRLRTDYVDLWQLHAWDPMTPMDESLAAIDDAVRSGRARYAGISNYAAWQAARAATWQRAVPGRAPIVTAQMEYSLLGRGVLTGKYRHGIPSDSRGGTDETAGWIQVYLNERGRRIVDAVATAADGLDATPAEVALAWVRDRPGVVAPIIGARTNNQLLAALASDELELPDEITRALDEVSAPALGYPEAGWAQRR